MADFSVLHKPTINEANIEAGDVLWLGTASYRILAVGEVANRNLESLGHLVIKFNGREEPELPGDVCVEQKLLVPLEVGDEIRIESY